MAQRGTTPTQIRIPLDLKAAAKAKAADEGVDLSSVVVGLLRAWLDPDAADPAHLDAGTAVEGALRRWLDQSGPDLSRAIVDVWRERLAVDATR